MPPRPYNLVPRWPGAPGCHIVGKSAGEAQVRWRMWTAARRHRTVRASSRAIRWEEVVAEDPSELTSGTPAGLAGPHDGSEGEPGLGAAGTLPRGGTCPGPGQATRRLTMSRLAVSVLSVVTVAARTTMVAATTLSAVQTLVVPRATPMRLTRW